jgi:hypothetical protein
VRVPHSVLRPLWSARWCVQPGSALHLGSSWRLRDAGLACSQCHSVRYCTAEHQRLDWCAAALRSPRRSRSTRTAIETHRPRHKDRCQRLSKQLNESRAACLLALEAWDGDEGAGALARAVPLSPATRPQARPKLSSMRLARTSTAFIRSNPVSALGPMSVRAPFAD